MIFSVLSTTGSPQGLIYTTLHSHAVFSHQMVLISLNIMNLKLNMIIFSNTWMTTIKEKWPFGNTTSSNTDQTIILCLLRNSLFSLFSNFEKFSKEFFLKQRNVLKEIRYIGNDLKRTFT